MVDYAAAYLEAGDEVVEGAEELVALRGGRVLAEQPAHAVKLKLIIILYIIICFKNNEDKIEIIETLSSLKIFFK